MAPVVAVDRRTFVQGRGASYSVAGEGLPVVLLHGWALAHHTYRDVIQTIAEQGCRVIAPALPGFGGTAELPGDAILGEEGDDLPGTSGVRWVIDPIDGTVNYLYDLPSWAVSVAAEIDGITVVGVVAAPALGETYVAVRGRGARLHDAHGVRTLRVNDPVELPHALVATGFGYTVDRRRGQARVVSEVIPAVRDIRRGGACSIDLCSLAAGRVDAYYERGPRAWDLAAGGLVALEAGARVEGLHGAPAGEDLIIAAGPHLFRDLHDLLATLSADAD